MKCETVLDPGLTLHNIRGWQGGCATCAERGIDPTKPGNRLVPVSEVDSLAELNAMVER
jgi:hypothetical protein